MVILLSEADAALSELSGLGNYLPNPDLLIAPYVKREAVASSRIEGTQADLSDLLVDEIEPKSTPPGSDVHEIPNYIAALNLGIRIAIKQGRSLLDIREKYRDKLGKDHRAHAILDSLFINPYTTVALASKSLGVTAPTAGKAIDHLAKVGMLTETTGREWGRVWIARPIFVAFEPAPEAG